MHRRDLLGQRFPCISVRGIPEKQNTGNFIVRDAAKSEVVFSPFGFVSTGPRQRALLERIAAHYGAAP